MTCLNILGFTERKKFIKNAHSSDVLLSLTKEKYEIIRGKLIKNFNSIEELNHRKEQVKITESWISENKDLLDTTFHELRKLNLNLKTQSELLNLELEKYNLDKERIRYLTLNLFNTSRLISIRLNTYDFLLNPELNAFPIAKRVKVFKKIEKTIHCLKVSADSKGVRVTLKGTSHNSIMANDLFELLPFMLIENAIKYSPKNTEVEVKILETEDGYIIVRFTNLGPRPNDDEVARLSEKGFRSVKVEKIEEGSGLGLFLAQAISNIHNIEMDIKIGGNKIYYNNEPFSDFIITLKMKSEEFDAVE